MSEALIAASEHQPRVRATLVAALSGGPSHAYLLYGPAGSGKRDVARAFAAELLAAAAGHGDGPEAPATPDPVAVEETRRRALLDPSPHPDLVWLAPEGLQHRVEDIRNRVIRLASRRPFEGGRRVFVIEQAEAMRDEAQNALLKTLEEPPPYAHLILITRAVEEVLPTVRSRCQQLEFAPLPATVVEHQLSQVQGFSDTSPETLRTAARLAAGDLGRARRLASPEGEQLRSAVELLVTSTISSSAASQDTPEQPWKAILATAEQAGAAAEAEAQARIDESAEMGLKISKTEAGQAVRREARRARTEVLDLALDLIQHWLRDLSVFRTGADELIHNLDRRQALAGHASLVAEPGPRAGHALVSDYRRRLRLNVSEELAFEALHSALRRTLRT